MEAGLHVTFFEPGEAFHRELPPVGPLDHLVVGGRRLVAERSAVQQAQDIDVAIDRWLEAELELQRALGEEPGGTKRSELRVTARDGVYLRFAVLGDARERDLCPELGPFAVVVVGRRSVEADGQLLATRAASELAPWEMTSRAGADAAGRHKPDIAFRASGGTYHPEIVPLPPSPPAPSSALPPAPSRAAAQQRDPLVRDPEPFVVPDPVRPASAPVVVAPAAAPEPPTLSENDVALIERMERERSEELLRARLQEEERRRLGVDEADDAASTWAMRYRPQAANSPGSAESGAAAPAALDWRGLVWRMRFALIGLLLLAAGAYGFFSWRNGTPVSVASGGQQSFQTLGIAQKVTGTRWDYVVNGVQRAPTSGTSRARGTYYVVRIGVTNRGTEGAQLSPAEFTLIDASGTQYTAAGLSSGVYYGADNASSQFVWPQSFPVGKTASISVVFDVDPSLARGNQLAISELPRTRVNLD
jgi:hypothetical protein